jgi:acyl-CoA synthetase (AMP-forming)/AMP-acid ligase II
MPNSNLIAEVVCENHAFPTQDLLNFLSHKLPGYAIPKSVTFVEAIPRTPSGKIKRCE